MGRGRWAPLSAIFYNDQLAAMAPDEPGTFSVAEAPDSSVRRAPERTMRGDDAGIDRHRAFAFARSPRRSPRGSPPRPDRWVARGRRARRQVLGVPASAVLHSPEGPYVLAVRATATRSTSGRSRSARPSSSKASRWCCRASRAHDAGRRAGDVLRRRGSPPGRQRRRAATERPAVIARSGRLVGARHHWPVIVVALLLADARASWRAAAWRATWSPIWPIPRSAWWPTGWAIPRPMWRRR